MISKRSTFLLTVAASSTLIAACGSGVTTSITNDGAPGTPETVVVCGREVTFDSTPQRIVSLMPAQTDLLIRLGVRDQIVGQAQTATSDLPADTAAQARDIPVLNKDAPPPREELLAVRPDLVVAPTSYEFSADQGFADVEQLDRSGAKSYVAVGGCQDRRNTAEVTDVFTDITNLGTILGVENKAAKLVADGQARLKKVERAIAGLPAPSVAQLYVEGNSLSAVGAGVEADIVKRAGGANVFQATSPEFANFFVAQINPEELIARGPEVIVFGASGPEHEKSTRAYLAKRFSDVPAVRNGRLIAIPGSDLYPGTLGNITAVETIADGLYPGEVR